MSLSAEYDFQSQQRYILGHWTVSSQQVRPQPELEQPQVTVDLAGESYVTTLRQEDDNTQTPSERDMTPRPDATARDTEL